MGYLIEPLTESDVEATARCHNACLVEAYAEFVPEPQLAAMTDEPRRLNQWRERFAQQDARIVIARDDRSQIVGLAHAGPPRQEFPELPPLELYSLYTRRATLGTGLGAQLMQAAIGDAAAWLWVYEPNARAQRFYAKQGFRPTGIRQVREGSTVGEIQMSR